MAKSYKIEVQLTELESPYPKKPYFWILYSYETDQQNEASGWAASPQEAWEEALRYYERYKKR